MINNLYRWIIWVNIRDGCRRSHSLVYWNLLLVVGRIFRNFCNGIIRYVRSQVLLGRKFTYFNHGLRLRLLLPYLRIFAALTDVCDLYHVFVLLLLLLQPLVNFLTIISLPAFFLLWKCGGGRGFFLWVIILCRYWWLLKVLRLELKGDRFFVYFIDWNDTGRAWANRA